MIIARGIVRKIDLLGRIVVPKEIRRELEISEGDSVEILPAEGGIFIKKIFTRLRALRRERQAAAIQGRQGM